MIFLKKNVKTVLIYLLLIAVIALISIYSVQQSLASYLEIIGDDLGLTVDPEDENLFTLENIHPGYNDTSIVMVRNEGNNPFSLEIDAELEGDDALISTLNIKIFDADQSYYEGPFEGISLIDMGFIAAGIEKELSFEITLPTDAGNETQNTSLIARWTFSASTEDPVIVDPTDPVIVDPPLPPEDFPAPPTDLPVIATPDPVDIEETLPDDDVAVVTPDTPEEVADVDPDEVLVDPEEPQIIPWYEDIIRSRFFWPILLLLIIPLLAWFILARHVLVLVTDHQGREKILAIKLARHKNLVWTVNVKRQIDKYLPYHGELIIDFKGFAMKDKNKSVRLEDTVLGTGSTRYARLLQSLMVKWSDSISRGNSRQAG